MQHLDFRAMGCAMRAVSASDDPGANDVLAAVPSWFAEWETVLSRFQGGSELNRLNGAAGRPVPVSKVLWEVLAAALDAAGWTDGLVSPMLLDAVERAGYDRSFERVPATTASTTFTLTPTTLTPTTLTPATLFPTSLPQTTQSPPPQSPPPQSPPPLSPPPQSPPPLSPPRLSPPPLSPTNIDMTEPADWRAIRMDPAGRRVTLPRGVRLDLGGIAKGWAADKAVRRLAAHGPALVDAGGDIAVSGPPSAQGRWPIAVADPFAPDAHLAVLWLDRGGIATSGRDFRRWQKDGEWRHHIIDARTGEPAATDVLSATVIAGTARTAEAAAKVALILGARAGLAWIEAHPPLAGLLVGENGEVHTSRRLDIYLGA